jgi:flagellar hook-basal body complex protein FliE
MTDPLGIVARAGAVSRDLAPTQGSGPGSGGGPAFKEVLRDEIRQVNDLQRRAEEAIEDLAAGRRDDLESVMIATQKADTAFRMLLQVRNKVMDAYEEVKQIRV